MLAGALVVAKACVVGFHTSVGSGSCQPSHSRKLPVCSSTECTATSGQFIRADHWPGDDAAGVIAADGADAGPAPTALVAVTVNVYVVPLVRPPTVVDVAGGEPDTTVADCAVVPT